MVVKWEVSLIIIVPFFLFFMFIEGGFLSSNLFKVTMPENGSHVQVYPDPCELTRPPLFTTHEGSYGWMVHTRGGPGGDGHRVHLVDGVHSEEEGAVGNIQAAGGQEHLCGAWVRGDVGCEVWVRGNVGCGVWVRGYVKSGTVACQGGGSFALDVCLSPLNPLNVPL